MRLISSLGMVGGVLARFQNCCCGAACGGVAATLGWLGTHGPRRHLVNLALAGATVAWLFVVADARPTLPSPDRTLSHLGEPVVAMAVGASVLYLGSGLTVAAPALKSGRLLALGGVGLMTAAFFLPFGGKMSFYEGMVELTETRPFEGFDRTDKLQLLTISLPASLASAAGLGLLSILPINDVARIRLSQFARLSVAWCVAAIGLLAVALTMNFTQNWRTAFGLLWLWCRFIAPAFIAVDAGTTLVALTLARR